MLGSARHLAEHLGEAPAIILACVTLDPGVKANLTTGASIYPAVQNIMLAARALGIGSCITTIHRLSRRAGQGATGNPGRASRQPP